MKKFYIAYGSNLNKSQMKHRCPHAEPYASGVLKDHELLFKGSKTGAYATVEPKKGEEVPIGVWLIDEADEKNLDRYEGYPSFYYKTYVFVDTNRGPIDGMIYIMHESRRIGQPTDHYVGTCLRGYDDFNLNKLMFLDALLTNELREVAK